MIFNRRDHTSEYIDSLEKSIGKKDVIINDLINRLMSFCQDASSFYQAQAANSLPVPEPYSVDLKGNINKLNLSADDKTVSADVAAFNRLEAKKARKQAEGAVANLEKIFGS